MKTTHSQSLPSQKAIDLFSSVISRANGIYAGMKLGPDAMYTAPELMPQIQSDQVRAICLALCEVLTEKEMKREESYK